MIRWYKMCKFGKYQRSFSPWPLLTLSLGPSLRFLHHLTIRPSWLVTDDSISSLTARAVCDNTLISITITKHKAQNRPFKKDLWLHWFFPYCCQHLEKVLPDPEWQDPNFKTMSTYVNVDVFPLSKNHVDSLCKIWKI